MSAPIGSSGATTFEDALIADTMSYTGTSFDLEVAAWLPDTPELAHHDALRSRHRTERRSAARPAHMGNVALDSYDRGVHDASRPQIWAQAHDGSLCVGPKPDKAYVLRGLYRRKKAQRLLVDGDTPIMPEDFHGLIVGEALRLMARSDEAFQVLLEKSQRYEQLRAPPW
jgi:hypothetical protein